MGGDFKKKSGEKPFFATPRPVLGHPPLPRMGGWGPPENSGTKYLCYYRQQPGVVGTA